MTTTQRQDTHGLTFRKPAQTPWGFQPLEALSEVWDSDRKRIGVIYKTYKNHPELIPGKPKWVYARDGDGGWCFESTVSEDDLLTKIVDAAREGQR